MVTQPETPVEDEAPRQLAFDAPDRGPADDAYFQRFIDEGTDEGADESAGVGVAEAEAPPLDIAPALPTAPTAVPQPTPNELDILRQQNQAYEQQLQQAALAQVRAQLDKETQEATANLEAQGLLPEQAAAIANRERASREQAIGAQQQMTAQADYFQGKMNAALYYAQKHNVSAQELMQHNTPQAMETAALGQSKVSALEQQVAALRRGSVPPQYMDNNQASPSISANTATKLVDSALAKHSSERTPAENEALARIAGG
jgi:hypothetical protein